MDRKLSAILAADVVGYSAQMERDEAGTFERLRTGRKELFEPEIARHHGHIFKLMGDGMLADFGSVVDAVECAVALQRGLAERNTALPKDQQIQVRIGINLGEVIVEGEDRYGEGVNIATRLQQLADPGGIFVSGKVSKEVEKKLAFGFEPMGERKVKNITEPIAVYRVQMNGVTGKRRRNTDFGPILRSAALMSFAVGAALLLLWVAFWPRSSEIAALVKPSIAVLPFDSIDSDETTDRLADGITEDIITDLARYRDLDVIARNSTAAYKGKPTDIRQVGRDLSVGYVLEGSVQRQADQVRITAQLLDGRTAAHIWSDRWDRPLADLFAVQTEISDKVTSKLANTNGRILASEHVARRRLSPKDVAAYDLYLQGRAASQLFTKESLTQAIPLLKQAVEKDPTLARAWVELAAAQITAADLGAAPIPRDDAMRSIRQAVALDPMDADAHGKMAHLLGLTGDFERSQAEYETSLRLNPGSTDVMTSYISWASTFGHPERGAELVDRVIRLNPDYPAWATGPFSYAYLMAGRYEDALRILEQQSSDNYTIYSWVHGAASNAALGRINEAKLWVKQALEHHPDLTVQSYVSDAGLNDTERERLIETMRAAGFPLCASPEQLRSIAKPVRLPECAKNAGASP